MRLTAVQAVRLNNREASQAERRRFEPGHPLLVQAMGDAVNPWPQQHKQELTTPAH
jgi:hypothetical protein